MNLGSSGLFADALRFLEIDEWFRNTMVVRHCVEGFFSCLLLTSNFSGDFSYFLRCIGELHVFGSFSRRGPGFGVWEIFPGRDGVFSPFSWLKANFLGELSLIKL